MSKKYRTEVSPEMAELVKAPHPLAVGELVWYFENRDGRRFEHLARVEALTADSTVTLSYAIMAENERFMAENVPQMQRESTGSGWAKAA